MRNNLQNNILHWHPIIDTHLKFQIELQNSQNEFYHQDYTFIDTTQWLFDSKAKKPLLIFNIKLNKIICWLFQKEKP